VNTTNEHEFDLDAFVWQHPEIKTEWKKIFNQIDSIRRALAKVEGLMELVLELKIEGNIG
jgi:hypothetical protein